MQARVRKLEFQLSESRAGEAFWRRAAAAAAVGGGRDQGGDKDQHNELHSNDSSLNPSLAAVERVTPVEATIAFSADDVEGMRSTMEALLEFVRDKVHLAHSFQWTFPPCDHGVGILGPWNQ